MKLTLTFEIEISDIPEKDRLEMLNDAGMEDEDMPRISAMSETQVRAEVTDAFYAMFDGSSYEDQSDMWAGSNFYGYITSIIAAPSSQSDVMPAPSEINDMIERLLDAQQDINRSANETMSQPLCDAAALIDELEPMLIKIKFAILAATEGSKP